MVDPSLPVLANFLEMGATPAGMEYLTKEMKKLTGRLHFITDIYDVIDWPLAIIGLEMYAQALATILPPDGRELLDALRKKTRTVVIDWEGIRRQAEDMKQKGDQ